MFGVAPLLGRTFTADEDQRGLRLAVLSEGFAVLRYGLARNAIGSDLEIGGAPWRVIGVMPASFRVPFLSTRIWMPVHAHPEWKHTSEANPRLRQRWDVIARLRPGVRLEAAQADVDALEAQFRAALPEFHKDNVRVIPLHEYFTASVAKQLWIAFAAVAFVLLMACVNAGSLLLSGAAARQREFA